MSHIRLSHSEGWRRKHGKNVPHPSQWGHIEDFSLENQEFEKPGDIFNPKKLKGKLSSRADSPWVWVLKGIDLENSLKKTDPSLLNILRAMKGVFIEPRTLNFELPTHGIPEVTFCGRSNVGKSTLVGTLINNSKIVRISKEPGCTQTVNYFGLLYPLNVHKGTEQERVAMYLVDLPGYGFARAHHESIAQWTKAVENYITKRNCTILRRSFLLIDIRHGIKKNDREMMKLLDRRGVSYQLILTKADKLRESEIERVVEDTMRIAVNHPACFPAIHVVSAKHNLGISELFDSIYYTVGLSNGSQYGTDDVVD